MQLRLSDPDLVGELVGFLQRSHCLAETSPDGTIDVYLPHDLPEPLERAEILAYLQLWARSRPDARAGVAENAELG